MRETRIAIYGRVSTKDKGQDTENQLCQLRDFCSRQEGGQSPMNTSTAYLVNMAIGKPFKKCSLRRPAVNLMLFCSGRWIDSA